MSISIHTALEALRECAAYGDERAADMLRKLGETPPKVVGDRLPDEWPSAEPDARAAEIHPTLR